MSSGLHRWVVGWTLDYWLEGWEFRSTKLSLQGGLSETSNPLCFRGGVPQLTQLYDLNCFQNEDMSRKEFHPTVPMYVFAMRIHLSSIFLLQSSLKSSKKKKRTSFKRKSSKKGAEVGSLFFFSPTWFYFVNSSCLVLYLNTFPKLF